MTTATMSGTAAAVVATLSSHVANAILNIGKAAKRTYGESEKIYAEVIKEIPMIMDSHDYPDVTKWCHKIYVAMPDKVKERQEKNPDKFLGFSTAEKQGNIAAKGVKSLELWTKNNLKSLFPDKVKPVADKGDPLAKAAHVLLEKSGEAMTSGLRKELEAFLVKREPGFTPTKVDVATLATAGKKSTGPKPGRESTAGTTLH